MKNQINTSKTVVDGNKINNPSDEDIKLIIANNIAKFRKEAKLTQAELAEKLNYSDKAISKWERGESLPDVIILNQIAKVFGITLDSLVSNKPEKKKRAKKIFKKIYSSKMLATACSSILVWLVATITFITLHLCTNLENLWMTFIYAITVNAIVLVSLQFMWKSNFYNFFAVSLLTISAVLSVYLTLFLYINLDNVWLLFITLFPLLILIWLWFIGRPKLKQYSDKNKS